MTHTQGVPPELVGEGSSEEGFSADEELVGLCLDGLCGCGRWEPCKVATRAMEEPPSARPHLNTERDK